MIRVAVLGALGNMGREVINAVREEPGMEVAAAVDVRASGKPEDLVTGITEDIDSLAGAGVDVLVDFTEASAAVSNITWALDHGVNAVVGTTGIDDRAISRIRQRAEGGAANVLIAPNFALGAVLMMKFAGMAAEVFDQCEIVELHHRGKKDSPSGTALATARMIDEAMDAARVPPAGEPEVVGARGGTVGPVHIHSVRLDGLIAHQEVIFGSRGQTLTIRHDTVDRSCFMPGVIRAIRAIDGLSGLTVGLEAILP